MASAKWWHTNERIRIHPGTRVSTVPTGVAYGGCRRRGVSSLAHVAWTLTNHKACPAREHWAGAGMVSSSFISYSCTTVYVRVHTAVDLCTSTYSCRYPGSIQERAARKGDLLHTDYCNFVNF